MKILRKYPYSVLIALAIWVVCMIPIPETPLSSLSFVDKWTHFLMYGIFTIVILWEHRRLSSVLLLLPIIQGIVIEFVQTYLTTCRSGEWFDALCNTLGVLLGALLFWSLGKTKKSKKATQ